MQCLLSGGCAALCLPGDANDDGQINTADIEPFVTVLLAGTGTAQQFCAADLGGPEGVASPDGVLDGRDVQAFVACLVDGNCPPPPDGGKYATLGCTLARAPLWEDGEQRMTETGRAARLSPKGAPACSHGCNSARRPAGGVEPVENWRIDDSVPKGRRGDRRTVRVASRWKLPSPRGGERRKGVFTNGTAVRRGGFVRVG